MKFYTCIVVILVLAANVSAECRDKECMTNSYDFNSENSEIFIYYNEIFEIGSNWFIIIDAETNNSQYNLQFEFSNDLTKKIILEDGENSLSFSGSSFTSEMFHKSLYANITDKEDNSIGKFTLTIHINKSTSEDMFYLWGGMTVFWLSIGLYVLYISNKYRELNSKLGQMKNGNRKKD